MKETARKVPVGISPERAHERRFLEIVDYMGLAKILILEDNDFTRGLLETSLTASGFQVVLSGKTALVAIEAVKKHKIEVALLDLDLGPGPSGIDVALALRKVNPNLGLVFLTTFKDPRLSQARSLELPIGSRYLVKSQSTDINRVTTAILQAKFSPLRLEQHPSPSKVPINDKQVEILKMLAGGLTNSEIASRTASTEKVVEHTISRIFFLLDLGKSPELNSRVQLARAFDLLTGRQ